MPRLLFIGSTVADVVIRVPTLPATGQDLHIAGQQVSLGGCAYNAFHAARLTGLCETTLLSPVGTGLWGDWVHEALKKRGVVSAAPRVKQPNGCCYCLVEEGGERTFLCEHGAEYRIRQEWVRAADPAAQDGVYLCGLELEEETGGEILTALEASMPKRLYFAPGPRILQLEDARLKRIQALQPVYHLNAEEAMAYTGAASVQEAAQRLHILTGNDVVITLGPEGAWVLSARFMGHVPGVKAQVVDTIGAGDAHVGALMAAQAAGMELEQAVRLANRVAAAVVSCAGAELSEEAYQQMMKVQEI